jgi:hypothetical protein
MTIDTLSYVKRREAAGIDRRHAEAQAEAMRDDGVPQLATKADLDRVGDRLEQTMETLEQKIETLMWKHPLGILLGVLAIGGVLSAIEMRLGTVDTRLGAVNVGLNCLDARMTTDIEAIRNQPAEIVSRLPKA